MSMSLLHFDQDSISQAQTLLALSSLCSARYSPAARTASPVPLPTPTLSSYSSSASPSPEVCPSPASTGLGLHAHGSPKQASISSTSTSNTTATTKLPLLPSPKQLTSFESWFGFVKDKQDANLLVEAVIAGAIRPLKIVPADAKLRSGSVIVFAESGGNTQLTRWRDGSSWSPSRIHGDFLLYREVESTKKAAAVSSPSSVQTLNAKCRFATTSFRPNTRLVAQGFAKRTITIVGSDGVKYRVISYFFPHDVAMHYGESAVGSSCGVDSRRLADGEVLQTPSECGFFERYGAQAVAPVKPVVALPALQISRKRTFEDVVSEEPVPHLASPAMSPKQESLSLESRLLGISAALSRDWMQSTVVLNPLKKMCL
ncbi:hypothetical protein BCR33DRAFT_714268 [Rhizoclosmatium globosum]|uniref:Uncharacterized protein n=1 Tax=Rhizoclosmatium globosum TaxID=329046 RepID=A0A1Y2CN87_9FUNG|nr:hypothetical protein BCR33DRAFT_714268 [Rhizoclosmatium globosum]|eukprot:ORY48500.1 hypothetical protein BCR33DRAFT_714268 [Rhizoclosmatium globosum]